MCDLPRSRFGFVGANCIDSKLAHRLRLGTNNTTSSTRTSTRCCVLRHLDEPQCQRRAFTTFRKARRSRWGSQLKRVADLREQTVVADDALALNTDAGVDFVFGVAHGK